MALTASIMCVTLLMHFSHLRNVLMSFNDVKMSNKLEIAVKIFLHNILALIALSKA